MSQPSTMSNEDRPRQEEVADHYQHPSASSHLRSPPLNTSQTFFKLDEYLKQQDRLEGLFNGQHDGHAPRMAAMTDYLQRWDHDWNRL
ncbi:MAG: hypothetical protein FRX48_04323 [Lasallia pustulata]|uniref:Uncharacterized protein n=1 Tax=Lasallia pustulata TaxID=136370 RepID=A0A5M8PT54_9LECA|nr:MAG: hypothetical protein FRX48_04323 [Lasallia pustulata]